MKKIILLIFVLMIPFSYGMEMYTTHVDINVTALDKVTITGEEGASLTMSTNSSATNTMTLFIYRNNSFEDDLSDLNDNYDNLTDLYNQCVNSIDHLNETLDQNRSTYYDKYTNCYFSLINKNSTLISLNNTLDNCENKLNLCENNTKINDDDYDDCQNQRDNYRNQYVDCDRKLGGYTGDNCMEDLSSKNLNFVWGLLVGLIGMGGFWSYNNKKNRPTSDHPLDEMENLEEPF